jgi:hypothetical protein
MPEVVGAFVRAEGRHKRADPAREARNGWFGSFPCLQFAEGVLDRVEAGELFGKITQLRACCFNDFAYCGNPVITTRSRNSKGMALALIRPPESESMPTRFN